MTNKPNTSPKDLTQSALAKRWRISPHTLERWRWTGEGLQFVKIGRLVRYRLEDVEAYEARAVQRLDVENVQS